MTTLLKATSPAELLGLIPTLAGFTPRESLVLLPFRGTRTGGAMRIDLPGPSADLDAYAATVVGLLCQIPQLTAVAVAVYDEAPVTTPLPRHELAVRLLDRIDACGFEVIEAMYVGADDWAVYFDEGAQRHPLAEVPLPPAVPGVGDVSGDQRAGAQLIPPPPGARKALREALGRRSPVSAQRPEDVPALADEALTGPPDVDQDAALVAMLNAPLCRDIALAHWARGGEVTARGPRDPSRAMATVLAGMGPPPDVDRVRLALALCRRLAALAPAAQRSGPLVAAAWLSWALGRSSHADEYLQQVLRRDPEHRLAGLLVAALAAGMLPTWVFAAPTA